jgi:hypothetical protein
MEAAGVRSRYSRLGYHTFPVSSCRNCCYGSHQAGFLSRFSLQQTSCRGKHTANVPRSTEELSAVDLFLFRQESTSSVLVDAVMALKTWTTAAMRLPVSRSQKEG